MKPYYSILFSPIKTESGERLSVGILLVTPEGIKLGVSKNKESALKTIFSKNRYSLYKSAIGSVQKSVRYWNKRIESQIESFISLFDSDPDFPISFDQLITKSKYSNNSLNYSYPAYLDVSGLSKEELFDKLFSKYVDDITSVEQVDKAKFFNYKYTNKEKLELHYSYDGLITSNQIPGLIAPVTVDLAGQNGIPVFVKAIDMRKNWKWVNYDISSYLNIRHFSPHAKMFVVGIEPEENLIKQKMTWRQLRKSDAVEYIPENESDIILEYAKERDVTPFENEFGEQE